MRNNAAVVGIDRLPHGLATRNMRNLPTVVPLCPVFVESTYLPPELSLTTLDPEEGVIDQLNDFIISPTIHNRGRLNIWKM